MLKSVIILAVTTVYFAQADTRFLLFTRNNPSVPEDITDESSVASSNLFNRDDNTIILIHGHRGSARTPFNTLITENILKFQEPHNVIVVDWEKDASYSYSTASARVPFVARDLDFFLLWLAAHQSIPIRKVHLVGFGLGAHIAGIASRWYVGQYGYRHTDGVGRITGLDPSGSGWGTNSQRLRNTDADYVEVIHTDGSGLLANGIGTAIGDINFYVNGGSNQPGCLTHSCSHNRAYEIFAASMYNHNLVGFPCSSTTQLNLNRCTGSALNIGGTELYKMGSSRIYRINTRI
ncbi:hypothetical protein PYW08_002086 [Mythimna loreyi]|uniref:Uncharacterized protein n=1 Tax=Mythimna loreyi TaxID=667449 RepID=A0ACC2R1B3_9NEOP|nr:hypothetical protein PYW08_002086 [Mythimna loreyi]